VSKMQMQAQVVGVEPRIVKEGTPDQRTIYDVIDSNGIKWTAWERPLAERAFGLKDQNASWTVEQKQSGKYTNRTLVSIEPIGDKGMTNVIDSGFPSTPNTSSNSTVTFDSPGSTPNAERTSIHRQTAVKAVAALAAGGGMTPSEFWSNVQDIVRFFETGNTPGGNQPSGDADPGSLSSWGPFEEQTNDDIPF